MTVAVVASALHIRSRATVTTSPSMQRKTIAAITALMIVVAILAMRRMTLLAIALRLAAARDE